MTRAPRTPVAYARRRRLLLCAWCAAGVVVLARAAQLQLVEGERWRSLARSQHRKMEEIPAPRGRILDRDGVPLALSQESYRVAVAPGQVEDPDETVRLLAGVLGVDRERARAAVGARSPWVLLPGHYPPEVRETLAGVPGVHLIRELRRFLPQGEVVRGVLGAVDEGGRGVGGLEQAFDSLLAGRPGRAVVGRNAAGAPIPGEVWVVEPPRAGADLVLTLDLELQEIAWEAAGDALETSGARSADLIIADPVTGEILALVSRNRDGRGTLASVHTTYEPGSTLKPFTVAALLAEGLAAPGDTVDTGDGVWRFGARTVRDVHPYGILTLSDALRLSSNVGVGRFAERLPPGVHYRYLRDFGFGTPTGIPLPAEAPGTLRRPREWSAYSTVSVAIGYEVAVTPLQMVMAYAALANGGVLMEPRIVREVRPPGEPPRRVPPRALRRVVPRRVARLVARLLEEVVAGGTGRAADLRTFRLAGKTGTARFHDGTGGYHAGEYEASFVGFFPAEDPQLVILVKLDRPSGEYYGGRTAAPVTRATLEAILAARRSPLDRRRLAVREAGPPPPLLAFPRFVDWRPSGEDPAVPRPSPLGVDGEGVPVPRLAGLPIRVAARRLHALGLRVAWEGAGGPVGESVPGPGARVRPGATVRLLPRRGPGG